MPLPSTETLNQFGLLEQIIGQDSFEKEFDELMESAATPLLFREYFTLLQTKRIVENKYFDDGGKAPSLIETEENLNEIKQRMESLFEAHQEESPELVMLCKAHLFIAVPAKQDGSWVAKSSDADPDNREKAIPLLKELQAKGFGIAYRLEAEVIAEEDEKRKLYQDAAERGDLNGKALLGYDYLAYLISESTRNNRPFAYPKADIDPSPLSYFQDALKQNEPLAVAKKLTFLTNITNAIKDLTPKEDKAPLENQSLFDDKLITLLECAEAISSPDDKKLLIYIQEIKKPIPDKRYSEARNKAKEIEGYINEEYKAHQDVNLKQNLHDIAQAPSSKDKMTHNFLKKLYGLYREEINRIQKKDSLSESETQYLRSLQAAKKEVISIENLGEKEIKSSIDLHIDNATSSLEKVPHASRFVRIIEELYNSFRQNWLGKAPDYQFFSGTERARTQDKFHQIKDEFLQIGEKGDRENPEDESETNSP